MLLGLLVGLLQFSPLRCSKLNNCYSKAPECAKLSCSCHTATPKDMSCSASTRIVTLASDFPSNQLQAGDLGVPNIVNIPTDISSSTHPPPSLPALLCHYAPHNNLCSRCHGLKLHTVATLSAWLYQTFGINCLLMFSLRTVCLCFEDTSVHCRLWRQVVTVT